MKKRMYKKGEGASSEMLMTIAGVILAVAVILLTVLIVFKLSSGFAPPEAQATFASYDGIISRISRMLRNTDEIYISEDFPIQISGDYIFIGFNKDEDFAIDGCYPDEKVSKPNGCHGQACFCYYKGHYEDFENNRQKRCTPLPGVDYLITLNYAGWYYQDPYKDYGVNSKIYKNIVGRKLDSTKLAGYPGGDYSYLFMYGHCDAWWVDQNFGNPRIYLEKFYDEDEEKTYILIAAYTPELIGEREELFKKWLETKPKPKDYFEKLKYYCEHKEDILWWFEVRYNAERLKGTAYENNLADYKSCIEDAEKEKKKIEQLNKKDIEEERTRLPPPFPRYYE